MDQLVQCPVCTLFLHNGMSLESHLDTHPKDQVIKALCSIANKNSSCGSSRASTPATSERSYRSRSRTPAAEDSARWSSAHRAPDNDRYWTRTPSGSSSRAPSRTPSRTPSRNQSRTPRSISSVNISRNCTPDIRMVDNIAYESGAVSSLSQHSNQSSSNLINTPGLIKCDKNQQTYPPSSRLISSANISRNCTPDTRMVDNIGYETATASNSSQISSPSPSNLTNPMSMKSDKMLQKYPSSSRSTPSSNISRNGTHDIRMVDNIVYETAAVSSLSQYPNPSRSNLTTPVLMKSDKMQQTYTSPTSEYEQKYPYYTEQHEDREVKYSRSAEYNSMDSNNVFTYHVPIEAAGMKVQPNVIQPNITRKRNEPAKVMPKTSNLLSIIKSNMGGMQYMTQGGKPVHVMVGPPAPAFVHKNVQNSMMLSGSLPSSQVHRDAKPGPPLVQNHFNQLSSGTFTPGTTVVTQNSQYFYQEMVQSIDPKTFIPSIPTVFTGQENVTNVAQTSSIYQNVMLVDQFGNTSCMYPTSQPVVPKQSVSQMFMGTSALLSNTQKHVPTANDHNKTLVIEVTPIIPTARMSSCNNTASKVLSRPPRKTAIVSNFTLPKTEAPNVTITEKVDAHSEGPGTTRGLKILSNIKVEVPVQHNKNMINTVMDLTGSSDRDYPDRSASPENILPDIETEEHKSSHDFMQPSTSRGECSMDSSHSFAELTKITSPTSNKDSSKNNSIDNKIDMEFSDSCPVPDLICNEKPSISPISELSESGDNSTDRISVISPKPEDSKIINELDSKENKIELPIKPFRSTPLRLNNIFVKKSKKILQIKNMKMISDSGPSKDDEPMPCSSTAPVSFAQHVKKTEIKKSMLKTISIEEIREKDVAGFEAEQVEDAAQFPSPLKLKRAPEVVHVKEEFSSSNEGTFSNQDQPELTSLDPLRPSINVVSYENMSPRDFDEESSNHELLDLESATKTKQFVNMISENYFGDNMYEHYFTPDRVEAFDDKAATVFKDSAKETFSCNIWGEPSTKESEFVLPNFIHESYKIADSGMDYAEGERDEGPGDGERERDSKVDVLSESRSDGEPTLNICADERMPPRGELSGQESNGDMDSSWNGTYSAATPAEPYDLMARESWVSDGSELDVTDKRDNLEELGVFPAVRQFACGTCGGTYPTMKELRAHAKLAHAPAALRPSLPPPCTSYKIKKEEKMEDGGLSCATSLLSLDSKENILQAYDTLETKPGLVLRGLVKQEAKRKRRDFVCPTCKVDQVTDAAFNAHLRTHPLECLKCGKCFHRRANLNLHLKTHLGIKNYKCEICEKRFLTRQKLSEHHNIHTGRSPVKCTHCDDTFRRYSNMVQHRNRHHFHKRGVVRDYVCQCGLVLHSRAKLAWHRETHDTRPKACAHCPDKFVHAASLTRHVRRKHNALYLSAPSASASRAENVACLICKQIYLRTNLRAHLLTHSGKRPYSCVVCNKAFTTKWNLKLHRWTHLSRSAKPFKCALCKGAFIRKTEYISHMNSHKSVRPYTCNYCGCQFIRKYNCQRHVKEHETAKKYVCEVPECGKSFHRSYYLSEHMKVHSGARPFSCNICGKTSSNKSNHNKHVKIHHAREPVATEA